MNVLHEPVYVRVDVHVLLLTDVLVLMEKHEDKDKFYLRSHNVESVGGAKEELSRSSSSRTASFRQQQLIVVREKAAVYLWADIC